MIVIYKVEKSIIEWTKTCYFHKSLDLLPSPFLL
jgi:hypothetical protein